MSDEMSRRYADALAVTNTLDEIDLEFTLQLVLGLREEEVAKLREERDLAIAHDRQPYPTAWAYEQVCKARDRWQERAESAEAAIARVRRLCELTIAASCRVQAIDQARDTLAALDDAG